MNTNKIIIVPPEKATKVVLETPKFINTPQNTIDKLNEQKLLQEFKKHNSDLDIIIQHLPNAKILKQYQAPNDYTGRTSYDISYNNFTFYNVNVFNNEIKFEYYIENK